MQHSKQWLSSLVAVFSDEHVRNLVYQFIAAAVVGGALFYLATNTVENLTRLGIASGFGFLGTTAGYDVSESFIEHSARSTIGRIFVVGLINTLYVSAVGIVLATILGVLIGVARVSSNWIVARLSAAYIEVFRNTPMLLQIAFWYALVRSLPPPRQALQPLSGVFISNRGLLHPLPQFDASHAWSLVTFAAATALAILYWRWAARLAEQPGGVYPCSSP